MSIAPSWGFLGPTCFYGWKTPNDIRYIHIYICIYGINLLTKSDEIYVWIIEVLHVAKTDCHLVGSKRVHWSRPNSCLRRQRKTPKTRPIRRKIVGKWWWKIDYNGITMGFWWIWMDLVDFFLNFGVELKITSDQMAFSVIYSNMLGSAGSTW